MPDIPPHSGTGSPLARGEINFASRIVIPCCVKKYVNILPFSVVAIVTFSNNLSQGIVWHSIWSNSNQTVCSFSTPHPRSTSFCAVCGFTQAGELSEFFTMSTNPWSHFMSLMEMPDLNCAQGEFNLDLVSTSEITEILLS